MMFASHKSLLALFGTAALFSGATRTAAFADEAASLANNNAGEFLRRSVASRIPSSPELMGGGGKQVAGGIDPAEAEATGATTVALRLGATFTPRTRFLAGVDVTLPRLSIGRGFSTRIDLDAIVSANFGGVSTLIPVTFNQVYSRVVSGGNRFYVGAGIGPNFGEITRFGGKVFVGGSVNDKFGLELDVYFPGFDQAYVGIMARLPFSF